MRAYSGWLAAVLVGTMVATPDGQQGQGASIGSNDATAVLRSGPLSRMPGESLQVLSAMPDRFPRELLPEGAAFAANAGYRRPSKRMAVDRAAVLTRLRPHRGSRQRCLPNRSRRTSSDR